MKVLLLAPQPFYQERGTPIAVKMLLEATAGRGIDIDLVTFPGGIDLHYDHVRIVRTPALPGLRNLRPGFSVKKLIYDILMAYVVIRLLLTRRYDLVHAVEESVFIALWIRWLADIPFVYDMDSSLIQQLTDKVPLVTPLSPILQWGEGLAVANAIAVVPVCRAIAEQIARYTPNKVVLLPDVSLLEREIPTESAENIRKGLPQEAIVLLYVGNLEHYQGIDLLLQAFSVACSSIDQIYLMVIGGRESDIARYDRYCQDLAFGERVRFLGPRPIRMLAAYLDQADVLVSPRTAGNNTPMKIYSYLDSGKAVLATNLPTHTQVLDEQIAYLVKPTPAAMARGIQTLATNASLRRRLGETGRAFVKENHSLAAFQQRVDELYEWLKSSVARPMDRETPLVQK